MAESSRKAEHQEPLLNSDDDLDIELDQYDREPRPASPKPSSSTPSLRRAARTKIIWCICALLTAIFGLSTQTESVTYYQDVLGWDKPWCSLYITHSCLCIPWILHTLYLRFANRDVPYRKWVDDYNNNLRGTIGHVDAYAATGPGFSLQRSGGPMHFLLSAMTILTLILTVNGGAWFLAVSLTTPGDVTAIYNCAIFFAAVFSVPLLKQKLSWTAIFAVALSITGTFVIAYGDTAADHSPNSDAEEASPVGTSRFVGNIVALVGAMAFGLYEVLFKKWTAASKSVGQQEQFTLTMAASALTGIYTLCSGWLVLAVLHFTGVEPFVLPSREVALYVLLSVFAGSCALNALLLLVTWTNPVFGSVTSL